MNIIIIPSWYKRHNNQTLGSFFREQAIALSKSGHNVTLFYCNNITKDERSYYTDYSEQFLDEGVYTVIRNIETPRGFGLVYFIITIISEVRKYLKNNKVDIIHAHSYKAGFVAAIIKKVFGIPYVITEHSTKFSRNLFTKKDVFMVKRTLANSNRIIAVSQGLKTEVSKFTSKSIDVIPNMVSNIFFDNGKDSLNISKNAVFTFFTCSYLTYKKGIDILLKACSKLVDDGRVFKLVIGGDGEERSSLENLTSTLGLKDSVVFKGNLDRHEVVENMNQADAFVLPSRHETFGIVYTEALAMGTPVIMTETDAASMIVNDCNGVVVPIGDSDKLAEAMEAMIVDIESFKSEVIRKECRDKFSEEKIVQKLNKIYKEVCL